MEDGLALGGDYAFGVELKAEDGAGEVTDGHYVPVFVS